MIVVILGTLAVTISAVVIRNWRSSGDQRCDERWGQR
jgi:hypothetical protein